MLERCAHFNFFFLNYLCWVISSCWPEWLLPDWYQPDFILILFVLADWQQLDWVVVGWLAPTELDIVVGWSTSVRLKLCWLIRICFALIVFIVVALLHMLGWCALCRILEEREWDIGLGSYLQTFGHKPEVQRRWHLSRETTILMCVNGVAYTYSQWFADKNILSTNWRTLTVRADQGLISAYDCAWSYFPEITVIIICDCAWSYLPENAVSSYVIAHDLIFHISLLPAYVIVHALISCCAWLSSYRWMCMWNYPCMWLYMLLCVHVIVGQRRIHRQWVSGYWHTFGEEFGIDICWGCESGIGRPLVKSPALTYVGVVSLVLAYRW